MKKTFIFLMLIPVLVILLSSTAFAADIDLVEDLANILTTEQRAMLLERAETISAKYRCNVAIFIMDEMDAGENARMWAEFIYNHYNLGYGSENSGLLLFMSMADRDFALVANGFGHVAFTDHGKDVILDRHVLPLLRRDNYYEAFNVYLDKAEEFLSLARDGTPFDVNTDPDAPGMSPLLKVAIVILLPMFIAWLICSAWKSQMKTAKIAKTACNYIPPGGFNLTGQVDSFLYQTVTRTKIQTSSSSSSGGTTKSSSGFSGRSGKF